jgi:hypothetical protein
MKCITYNVQHQKDTDQPNQDKRTLPKNQYPRRNNYLHQTKPDKKLNSFRQKVSTVSLHKSAAWKIKICNPPIYNYILPTFSLIFLLTLLFHRPDCEPLNFRMITNNELERPTYK